MSVLGGTACADQPPVKGLQGVPHDRVQLSDGFWRPRQRTHHEVTIPHALDCLEAIDHDGVDVAQMVLPRNKELSAGHRLELLGGVTVVTGESLVGEQQPITLTAVPYYAWCNREKGPMTVWINEDPVSDR